MRRLGSIPVAVGPIAYGCWRFAGTDVATARAKIETALDAGLTLVDTADIYGLDGPGFGASEELLGAVLADAPELRDRMVLATKGGIRPPTPYDSSPDYLREACEASLRRLRVEVIDLYQVHRPDLLTHPQEVAAALDGLRADGLVREIGVSNYSWSQLEALRAYLDSPVITTPPEFSALHLDPLDDGVLDQAMALEITPLAWSPLARGALLADPPPDGGIARVQAVLDRLAAREGVDRAAVALAFVLAHPSAPVAIIGTQRLDRIRAATDAIRVQLSREDCYAIIAAAGRALP